MTIVVVSPHRDDAAFSLGLTISAWAAQKIRVVVLNCFTRSVCAPFAELETVHANDRESFVSALRLREDLAWQRLLPGRIELQDLGLRDAPLRLGIPDEATTSFAPREGDRAVRKIRRGIADLRPDAVLLPLALGGHVDHRTALEAGLPEQNAGWACAFYEDLPYASRLLKDEKIPAVADAIEPGLSPSVLNTTPNTVEEASRQKRRMALCYDSQVNDATADEIAGFSRRYGGRERLWVRRSAGHPPGHLLNHLLNHLPDGIPEELPDKLTAQPEA